METFAYKILIAQNQPGVAGGIVWIEACTMKPIGSNLPVILNNLGALGWEVVSVGDIAFDARVEIILKKRLTAQAEGR